MSDEKENILKELRKSGFPTEIKVTEYLKNKSERIMVTPNKCYWRYNNQQSYLDESENKIREIDLCATVYHPHRISFSKDNKLIKLYIECKKSDKAKWVFYTKPPNILQSRILEAVRDAFRDVFSTGKMEKYNPFNDVPDAHKTINPHIGLTYQIVFRDKDDFYTAQMQALKAIFYCEKNSPRKNEKTLIIPVVVFEGGMYRYDMTNKEPELQKIRYLRYRSHGIPESPIPLYVDVVHFDFFPEYINLIEKEIIAL